VVSVRDRAIRATRREPAGESFLRELYGRVTESTLRDRIIRVLGESPTAATVAWLEALILNDNETVAARDRALRVLGDELSEPERVRMLYPRLGTTRSRSEPCASSEPRETRPASAGCAPWSKTPPSR
jgi:hypothetical protein